MNQALAISSTCQRVLRMVWVPAQRKALVSPRYSVWLVLETNEVSQEERVTRWRWLRLRLAIVLAVRGRSQRSRAEFSGF